jgi:hypothetical protein
MLSDLDDNLCRVELMASGNSKWDLSPNDLKALNAVLNDRKELAERVKRHEARLMAEPEPAESSESSTPSNSKPTSTPRSEEEKPQWKAALERCCEITRMVEELQDRAFDFGASVEEKVYDIAEWIEENEHVTDAQLNALENMHGGVARWLN